MVFGGRKGHVFVREKLCFVGEKYYVGEKGGMVWEKMSSL